MSFGTILIGTDFSARAEAAIEQSIRVARQTSSRVVLVHAAPVPEETPPEHAAAETTAEDWRERLQSLAAASRKDLAELGARHADRGVKASSLFLDAYPDEGIEQAVGKTSAGLVVLGIGKTGFAGRLPLGCGAHV